MWVFLDVETDGLVKFKKKCDAPDQPHILSIGAVGFTEDGAQEVFSYYTIIRPENFSIDNNCEAVKINGITQELAVACGIKYKAAVTPLEHICYRASKIIIFNAEFEAAMFEIERARWNREAMVVPRDKARCLMLAMTAVIKEPGYYQDYKWPKFNAAYKYMYGVEPENQHHALHDARQSAWLTFEVIKQGLWTID